MAYGARPPVTCAPGSLTPSACHLRGVCTGTSLPGEAPSEDPAPCCGGVGGARRRESRAFARPGRTRRTKLASGRPCRKAHRRQQRLAHGRPGAAGTRAPRAEGLTACIMVQQSLREHVMTDRRTRQFAVLILAEPVPAGAGRAACGLDWR